MSGKSVASAAGNWELEEGVQYFYIWCRFACVGVACFVCVCWSAVMMMMTLTSTPVHNHISHNIISLFYYYTIHSLCISRQRKRRTR
jgi:hypothetical protein